MASFWLLKLALKCIHHFAWPLVALGYPLCASVQAIETDSYEETRDLISYWILLSLIYLFEYAFLRLLQWFLFWPYIKLVVISWLIVPDFGRASYVYNNFIHSYVSTNPQAVICWLNSWRKFFVNKDNFLLHAEKYIKQNGTEALEKLIASKKSKTYKPDAELTNAVKAIDNKEMLQKRTTYKPDAEVTNAIKAIDNKEMLQKSTTYKPDAEVTNAVKAIDNIEILQKSTHYKPDAEVTNAVKAIDNKEMLQKSTTYKPDTEVANAVKAIDNKEMLQKSTTYEPDAEAKNAVRAIECKEMQQTNGKKLQTKPKDIKDLEVIEKKEILAGKQGIAVMPNLPPSQKNTSSGTVKTDGAAGEELPQRYTHNKVQKEWTCALCQVTTTSEEMLNSHLHGREHRANLEALKAKNQSVPQKQNSDQLKEEVKQTIINQLNSKNKKLGNIVNNGLKEKEVKNHKVQALQKNPCQPVGVNHTKLRCESSNEVDIPQRRKEGKGLQKHRTAVDAGPSILPPMSQRQEGLNHVPPRYPLYQSQALSEAYYYPSQTFAGGSSSGIPYTTPFDAQSGDFFRQPSGVPMAPPEYIPRPPQFDPSSFMTPAPFDSLMLTPSTPPHVFQNIHDVQMVSQMQRGLNVDLNADFFLRR